MSLTKANIIRRIREFSNLIDDGFEPQNIEQEILNFEVLTMPASLLRFKIRCSTF